MMFPRSYEISEPDYDVKCPNCGVNGQKMCPNGSEQALCVECNKWFKIGYIRYRIEHKTTRTKI